MDIKLSKNLHLYEIVIDRPTVKNALNEAMYSRLADILKNAQSDTDCRAVLIYGAEGNFTSGNDLQDFMHNPPSNDPDCPVIDFMYTLYHFSKPVVVAVEGVAIGIGSTMLAHCDLVYAANDAIFQMPFVNLGLTPEYGSSSLLQQSAGRLRANEALLLGEPINSDDALTLGLVNRILAPEETLDFARKQALKLTRKSPRATQETKRLIRNSNTTTALETMERELEVFFSRLESTDFHEAVTAMKERRAPEFS